MAYDPNLNLFGGIQGPGNQGPGVSVNPGVPIGIPQPTAAEKQKNAKSVIELSQRGLEASRAPKGHHLQVLQHGETPEQAAANDQWWYKRYGTQDNPGDRRLLRAANWVGRQVLDAVQDPLTPLSFGIPGVGEGRTLGGVALHQAERYALPAVAKASVKLTKIHPRLGELFNQVHDLGVDSETKRALAAQYGKGWYKHYAQRYVARNAVGNKSNDIIRPFRKELAHFEKNIPHDELDQIFRAVDSGKIDSLPEALKKNALRFKTMTQAMEHLEGTEALHKHIAANGYGQVHTAAGEINLPHTANSFNDAHLTAEHAPSYARRFVSDTPRGLQGLGEHREAYVPGMREHHVTPTGSGEESTARNALSTHDPHLEQRGDNVHYKDVNHALTATKHRIRTMAQAVAAHDVLHDARYGIKPEMLHDPVFKEFFMPTIIRPEDKNAFQRNLEIPKVATDFEKAGVFMTPTGHMARIGALAAIDDPVALAQAVYAMGKSYVKAVPKAVKLKQSILDTEHEMRATRMQHSLESGAVQSQSIDRHSPFIDALGKPTELARMSSEERVQKIATLLEIPKRLFETSGHILWHFDDEVKHAAFQRKLKGGMDPAEAALETNANLVDYTNRSGLADMLSPIVPFSTWRTKMPLAVIRGMIKRPGLVRALSRNAPAAMGGEQGGYTSGLPYSDVAHMISDPSKSGAQHPTESGLEKWARGSTAPWLRLLAGELEGKGKRDWWTAFIPPQQYLEQQIPIVGNAIQWSGHGAYHDSPQDSILQSLTTLMHSGKPPTQSTFTPQLFTADPNAPTTTASPAPPSSGYDPNLNEFK